MIGKTPPTNMTASAQQEWQALQARIAKTTGKEAAAETAAPAEDKATEAYDPKAQLKTMVADMLAKSKGADHKNSALANLFNNNGNATGTGGFNQLLQGLGLDNLSAQNGVNLQYASAQFQLNYSVMQTVSGADGSSYTNAMSFSLSLDFQSLTAGGASNPLGIGANDSADSMMAKLQDYFSPEKTGDRILGFALNFFGKSEAFKKGGDTEESRQEFSDYIGAAIQKGFDQAMGTLGKVSQEVQDSVDKTHTHVFTGLDEFVKTGITEKNKQQIADAMAWNYSFSMQMSSTQILYTPDGRAGSTAATTGLVDAEG